MLFVPRGKLAIGKTCEDLMNKIQAALGKRINFYIDWDYFAADSKFIVCVRRFFFGRNLLEFLDDFSSERFSDWFFLGSKRFERHHKND
jgi:hypothetical protein